MDNVECTKQKIRTVIAGSKIPEDPRHAENTLKWLLRIDPNADQALQIAALAHDIERAVEARKVRRSDYDDYDVFKAAHAHNGAEILREIMEECGLPNFITDRACLLVELHEIGGNPHSDMLKDADSISYFEVNMPLYYQREGWGETRRRCIWGYRRLSARMKKIAKSVRYEDEALTHLLKEAIRQDLLND